MNWERSIAECKCGQCADCVITRLEAENSLMRAALKEIKEAAWNAWHQAENVDEILFHIRELDKRIEALGKLSEKGPSHD